MATLSRLGVTASLSNKIYLGSRTGDLDIGDVPDNISRVNLTVDSDHYYTAGNDTGRTIEVSCPWGSQAMADSILAAVKNYSYAPYTASNALLDPAAEIGDAVTVGGVYSVVANVNMQFDMACAPEISAPELDEIEDEYPYESKSQRQINRKIAQTQAQILKTSEKIRLEVKNELNKLSASFSVTLNEIKSTVNGLNGQVSQISQKVNNITLSVQNDTDRSYIDLSVGGITVSSQTIRFTGDVVFESSLTDGSTMISGDNILTGEVSAEYIRLGGEMRVYEDLSPRADLGGYIGYVTSYDYNGSRTYGMGMIEAVSENQVVATSGGVRMTTGTGEVVVATNITLDTRNAVNVYANRFTSDVELNVTSDRNAKDDIRYDVAEKYIALFNRLAPVSFLYKGKEAKRHLGFIAQDVEDILNEVGIPLDDFAALSVDEEGRYGLSYGEFVAVLTAKIQQLEQRLRALEG